MKYIEFSDAEMQAVGVAVMDTTDSIPYDNNLTDDEVEMLIGKSAIEAMPDRDSELLEGLRQVIDELALSQDPRVVGHYDTLGMTYTPAQVQLALGKIYKDLVALL